MYPYPLTRQGMQGRSVTLGQTVAFSSWSHEPWQSALEEERRGHLSPEGASGQDPIVPTKTHTCAEQPGKEAELVRSVASGNPCFLWEDHTACRRDKDYRGVTAGLGNGQSDSVQVTCPNHTARQGRRAEQALPTLMSELDALHLPLAPLVTGWQGVEGCHQRLSWCLGQGWWPGTTEISSVFMAHTSRSTGLVHSGNKPPGAPGTALL